MFKVRNKDTRTTPIAFEHISHLVLVFLLLYLTRQMPVGIGFKLQRCFINETFVSSYLESVNTLLVQNAESSMRVFT